MDADEKLLEENGWEVECYSPYEIRHKETGSFASLWAADAVVSDMKQSTKLERLWLVMESFEGGLIDKDKFIEETCKALKQ